MNDAHSKPPPMHPHPPSGRGKWLVLAVVGMAVLLGIAASIYRASRPPRAAPTTVPIDPP